MADTAGIGSDHVDLEAAIKNKITVAEVTFCNSISVAELVVMMILSLVRNYIPSYQWVVDGGWNIADCVERSYDLEAMEVGTVAAGRIGLAVLRRLKASDVKLHYSVFLGVAVFARCRMVAIMANASMTSETWRCHPCHERVSL